MAGSPAAQAFWSLAAGFDQISHIAGGRNATTTSMAE
jgi:hypothetical protein